MKNSNLSLSIVTPTRGNFTEKWYQSLCQVFGDVEFVLVYPPKAKVSKNFDSRFKVVVSPIKGEVFQRLLGFLNASKTYVIALDDDDYIHPEVLKLVSAYFHDFPDSWCLRLYKKNIDWNNESEIFRPWVSLSEYDKPSMNILDKYNSLTFRELPIAPLNSSWKIASLLNPRFNRPDMHGRHLENFNNKVWKTELVHEAAQDLANSMTLYNALTWIPKWSLDRLMGLYLQGKFFEENKIIGHSVEGFAQIRYIRMPRSSEEKVRLMLPSDLMLARRFPQYGYFWNLFFVQCWASIRTLISHFIRSFKKRVKLAGEQRA